MKKFTVVRSFSDDGDRIQDIPAGNVITARIHSCCCPFSQTCTYRDRATICGITLVGLVLLGAGIALCVLGFASCGVLIILGAFFLLVGLFGTIMLCTKYREKMAGKIVEMQALNKEIQELDEVIERAEQQCHAEVQAGCVQTHGTHHQIVEDLRTLQYRRRVLYCTFQQDPSPERHSCLV